MGSVVEFKNDYYKKQSNVNKIPAMIANKYKMVACLKWTKERQVYLIEGKTDGKRYILKCSLGHSLEKAEEEYKLHDSLTHKGLVSAVEFVKDEDQACFVRDYIEGDTITELVEMTAKGHLPEEMLVDITLQLCRILDYLHTQEPPIIHRDIKPDNIIYTKQGECKLIDFGISRRYTEEQEKDTYVWGTRYAAPPEQYGFKQTDARSDIYSIGVLMLYMATGSLDLNEMDQYSIPAKLSKCIKKCTEFAPENRYQSIRQLEFKLANHSSINKKRVLQAVGAGSIILVVWLASKSFGAGSVVDHLTEIGKKEINSQEISNQEIDSKEVDSKEVDSKEIDSKEIDSKEIVSQEINSQEINSSELSYNSEYKFSSPMIEAAVRHELGLSDTDLITNADLDQVEELYLCGNQIYDNWGQHFVYGKMQFMNGAEYNQSGLFQNQGDIESLVDLIPMKNLHTLELYNQKITDISPLSKLNNLTRLGLGANSIEDITVLEGLVKLVTLDLSGNPLEDNDMLSLQKLPNLVDLNLGATKITSLGTIKELKLKSLAVFDTRLNDCEGIETMTSLEKLITTGVNNTITEEGLNNILKLINLKELRLMGGVISDLSMLTKLTSLTYLDLCGCNIDSIEELKGLNFTTLIFDSTQVTDLTVLKEFKEITTLGISNIPCSDYTPLLSLAQLRFINCNQKQAEEIKKQLGEISYEFWISGNEN